MSRVVTKRGVGGDVLHDKAEDGWWRREKQSKMKITCEYHRRGERL